MSKEVVKFIRKANDLVEARYKFDIWEMRLFTKMLTMIHWEDEDFKDYKIYLKDIVNDFHLTKNKDAYRLLRDGAKKLMKKTFLIPFAVEGVKREFEAPVISGLDSAVLESGAMPGSDHLYLTISFHPKMKPYLIQLRSQFTMYDVRNILELPSTYSIRIYELLKQYERIGWRTFTIIELKTILGIEDKYKLYGHFKSRVILKAQSDLLEFTDIQFTFDEIKKGRGVGSLKFHISKNKDNVFTNNKETIAAPIIEIPIKENIKKENPVLAELHLLIGKWMSKKAVAKLLNQYPELQVRNAIRYTLNRIKKGEVIDNVAGYIVNMAQYAEIKDPVVVKQKAHTKKKKAAAASKATKAKLQSELKEIFSEIHQEEMDLIKAIVIIEPNTKKAAIDKVKVSRLASFSYDSELSEEENLKKPSIQGAYINVFKKTHPEQFETLDRKYEKKITALKREISRL